MKNQIEAAGKLEEDVLKRDSTTLWCSCRKSNTYEESCSVQ
ncbi:MAG TPA: hypothetical protein PKW62_06850 [Chitinophagaceae bacterium]|nr:hypothetical protein [Chitinophagaceae bacterium]